MPTDPRNRCPECFAPMRWPILVTVGKQAGGHYFECSACTYGFTRPRPRSDGTEETP